MKRHSRIIHTMFKVLNMALDSVFSSQRLNLNLREIEHVSRITNDSEIRFKDYQNKKKQNNDFKVQRRSILRIDLHTTKKLIIQFHTSSAWKNACHSIFIEFREMVAKRYKLISAAA